MMIIAFLLSIILTRFFLYFFPISSPKIKSFKIHHYMYGILIMMISFIISSKFFFYIGFGLFLDEVPCLLLYGKFHYKEYNSKDTLMMLVLLIFISSGMFYSFNVYSFILKLLIH